MNKNLSATNPLAVPQTERTSSKQVENNAGGFVFATSPETRLKRFLIIGSTRSYYQPGAKITNENLKNVESMWRKDPKNTAHIIGQISSSGRAHNNDYALAALAVGVGIGGEARKYALAELRNVARIGTHILHFAQFLKHRTGWGRSVRKNIANWYLKRNSDKLAYQVLKYQSRDGWSHKDLLSMCHALNKNTPRPTKDILEYVIYDKISDTLLEGVSLIKGYELVKKATTEQEVCDLITTYGLTREMIPTQWMNSVAVWQLLMDQMCENNLLEGLIRNLNKLTSLGLFGKKDNVKRVVDVITNSENLHNAKLHPLKILIAMRQYSYGRGDKGSLTWDPVTGIVNALEKAYYAAFKNVEPTGKNIMLALDVSGSMGCTFQSNLSCVDAEACLAMVTARTEENYHIMKFDNRFSPFPVDPRAKLNDIVELINQCGFGSTDCSLPMQYAIERKMDIDTFIVYTDNETWAGRGAPAEWLRKYRSTMNKPNAQLIVVAFTATGFSIADPEDPNMMDIAGFDAAIPEIISSFINGEV